MVSMNHPVCTAQDDSSICSLGLEGDEIPNLFTGVDKIDADLLLLGNDATLSFPADLLQDPGRNTPSHASTKTQKSQSLDFECVGSGVILSEPPCQGYESGKCSAAIHDFQQCDEYVLPNLGCNILPLGGPNLDVSHSNSWNPVWHPSIDGINSELLFSPFEFNSNAGPENASLAPVVAQEISLSTNLPSNVDLADRVYYSNCECSGSSLKINSGHIGILSGHVETSMLPEEYLVDDQKMVLASQINDHSLRMQSNVHGQYNIFPEPFQSASASQAQNLEKQSPVLKRKGARSRISQEAKVILEHHFDSNPYPSAREVTIIAQLAGLEAKTVKNWFNNSRSRKQKVVDNGPSRSAEEGPTALEVSKSKASSKLSLGELDAMSMVSKGSSNISIERYLAEPLAEEPALLEDIEAAVTQNTSSTLALSTSHPETLQEVIDSRPTSPHNVTSPSSRWGNPHIFLAVPGARSRNNSLDTFSDSIGSDLTSGGYGTGGSAGTTFSGGSYAGSLTSSFGRAPRRGRKKWRYAPYSRKPSPPGYDYAPYRPKDTGPSTSKASTYLWHCTFCEGKFPSKYEWKRHETSVHIPQSNWVCSPDVEGLLRKCYFCGEEWPSESHLREHRYQECRSKPETERTFYRKDQLAQHIRQVHQKHYSNRIDRGGTDITDLLAEWHRPAAALASNDPALHCGFCGKFFPTLEERIEDVATHFKNGLDLTAWWSGRVNNEFENVRNSASVDDSDTQDRPCRCRYCHRVYPNRHTATLLHTHCSLWSCSFLPGVKSAVYSGWGICCCFCDEKLQDDKEISAEGWDSVEIHLNSHKFRECQQPKHYTHQKFLQHLRDHHGAQDFDPDSIGLLMLRKACVRIRISSFEVLDNQKAADRNDPRTKRHGNNARIKHTSDTSFHRRANNLRKTITNALKRPRKVKPP